MNIEKSNYANQAAAQFQVNQAVQKARVSPPPAQYSDKVSISDEGKKLAAGGNSSPAEAPNTYDRETVKSSTSQSPFGAFYQQVIDNKSGIDRKKIDEINAQIENISNDKGLSSEQKAELVEALNEAKHEITKQIGKQKEQKYKQV